MKLKKNKKVKGVRCGTCPYIIFPQNEAGGKIRIVDDKPMCARCRILRGKKADAIKADVVAFNADAPRREMVIQEKHNRIVRAVAAASIAKTKTGINK